MATSTISGDVVIRGNLHPTSFTPPALCIGDDAVENAAGIAADKLEHQHVKTMWLSDHATDFAATRRVLHCVYGATADLIEFSAGSTVLAGATTTVTLDLLKNGTTVLTTTVTLDSTNTAYILEDAVILTATAVTGDVLEVNATITGTNEPKGVFCRLVIREDAD